ncbi:MAG: DUF5693 family protein, partial [Armatimonadota bacterium]
MTRKKVLIAILCVGLAASAHTAAQRLRVESRNKAVELVVDYSEIAQISAATGKPPVEILRSLKQSGVTSVALSEKTVRDLMDGGYLFIDPDYYRLCYVDTHEYDIPRHLAMVVPEMNVRSFPCSRRRGVIQTCYLSFGEPLS